eukprot:9349684-Pyramimonas_sp.AAC.1
MRIGVYVEGSDSIRPPAGKSATVPAKQSVWRPLEHRPEDWSPVALDTALVPNSWGALTRPIWA